MLQPNIPRRVISFIKVWVSIVLIIATLAVSFTPLITLKTGDNIESINEILEQIDGADELEIPEEIGVSMPGLISSVGVMIDLFGIASSVDEIDTEQEANDTVKELEELLTSPEGRQSLLMTAAFVATITDGFNMERSGIGGMLSFIITIFSLIFILIFSFIAPVFIAIMAIIAVIRALKNVHTPELCAGKVGSVLPSLISLPLLYILFQSFVPGLRYGTGSMLIFIFSLISVVLSAICARLRKYSDDECKYSLIAQGTSILGVVGFLIYFFSIVKTNLFQNFILGEWSEVMIAAESVSSVADLPNGHVLAPIFMFLAVIFMFSSLGYIEKVAGRFAHSIKTKRGRASDVALVSAILLLLSYVFPVIVSGATYDYSKLGYSKELCFLEFTAAESSALTLSLVGIIIMLVAEIGLIVLKKVFAPELRKEDVIAVVTGNAKTPDEKLEEAQKVLEEASATVADADSEKPKK